MLPVDKVPFEPVNLAPSFASLQRPHPSTQSLPLSYHKFPSHNNSALFLFFSHSFKTRIDPFTSTSIKPLTIACSSPVHQRRRDNESKSTHPSPANNHLSSSLSHRYHHSRRNHYPPHDQVHLHADKHDKHTHCAPVEPPSPKSAVFQPQHTQLYLT